VGDSSKSDCPVAIFCGGEHVRLGRLARAQAKSLLVAHDTPILWRLLDQLRAAGFERIVAATTPRLERPISESVDHYSRASPDRFAIEVVARAEQERGLLFGLERILATSTGDRYVLCLGDIFFLANPFPALRERVDAGADCLVAAPAAIPEELALGGIVSTDGDEILAVIERPTSDFSGRPLRWSGLALSDRARALSDLESYLPERTEGGPPGDFFEFQRRRGRDLRCVTGPDFVNVNSPDHLLLASLYARLEADPAPGDLATSLSAATKTLRTELARGPSRGRSA
jgi:NDP-sugar pyrophosphorylase family protein